MSEMRLTVLAHIPDHSKLVKVASSSLGAKRLAHEDGDLCDVLRVEQAVDPRVGESELEQESAGVVSEEVVDSVDLRAGTDRVKGSQLYQSGGKRGAP